MKLLKLTTLTLVACVGLVACNELSGVITMKQSITVIDKKGKSAVLPTGSHEAKFEYKEDKREIELEIKNVIDGKKDLKMEFRIPAGVEVPRHSGAFALLGNEIGQPFDLNGQLDTQIHETAPTRGVESCTYTVRERVCERVCYDRVGRDGRRYRDCRRDCYVRDVTRYGTRDVEYHHITTTVSVDAELLETDSKELIGRLDVSRRNTQLVYDYVGPCYR